MFLIQQLKTSHCWSVNAILSCDQPVNGILKYVDMRLASNTAFPMYSVFMQRKIRPCRAVPDKIVIYMKTFNCNKS